MRRCTLSLLLLLTLLLSASQVRAQSARFQPSPEIYRLIISNCRYEPNVRVQTAFRVEGMDGLVTALHGIAGCNDILAQSDDEDTLAGLSIARVDVQRDVALITSPDLARATAGGLAVAATYDPESLQVIGYPRGRTTQARTPRVTETVKEPLINMVSQEPEKDILLERASPSVNIDVLNLHADVVPGHSGAPLLTADGAVAGIVDGGLAQGAVSIAWAIPWSDIEWVTYEEAEAELLRLAALNPELALSFSSTLYTEEDVKEIPLPELSDLSLDSYRFRMQASVDSLMGMPDLSGDVIFEGSYSKEEVWVPPSGRRRGYSTEKEMRALKGSGSLLSAYGGGLFPIGGYGYVVDGDETYFLMDDICILPDQSTAALSEQVDSIYSTLLELMTWPTTSGIPEGTLLGEETIHGIRTRHYLADPESMATAGAASGVTLNRAEFWISTRGNYLVKALMDMEGGASPEASMLAAKRLIINLEFYDIGADISLDIPDTCVAMDEVALPPASSTPVSPRVPATPTVPAASAVATIQDVWVEFDVTLSEQLGMIIHTDFTVDNLQGGSVIAAAYFGDAEGLPLLDMNGQYAAQDGSVMVGMALDLPYVSTRYEDLQLFIPYAEFHLTTGQHDLQLIVVLYEPSTNQRLAQSAPVEFYVNWSEPSAPAAPAAQIQDVQLAHNVTLDGVQGLGIHVHFTIDGYQDVPCQATVYFAFADGTPLLDYNNAYGTIDGQVATWLDFTPPYASTIYEDFQLFIPYSELHMAPGAHELQLHVEIHEAIQGGTLATSGYYNITYTD